MPTLQYHQRTFDLLNMPAEIDPNAVTQLKALEARLATKLPSAFIEWYSITDAYQHLRGNDDFVVPIEKLGMDKLAPENMLFLIDENQSCAAWAMLKDGSDNPPVYVADDDYERWEMCAQTFSDFVLARVWDANRAQGNKQLVMWDDAAFATELLDFLRKNYSELPTGYNGFWRLLPGNTVYRFQQGEHSIRLAMPAYKAACEIDCQDIDILLGYLKMLRPDAQPRHRAGRNPTTYYVGELTADRQKTERMPF